MSQKITSKQGLDDSFGIVGAEIQGEGRIAAASKTFDSKRGSEQGGVA